MTHVLTHWAVRRQDDVNPWRWFATGPMPGGTEMLTVVYVNGQHELVAILAYPATEREHEAYQRLRKENELCIPVDDTENR